jgi:hypothetical protein
VFSFIAGWFVDLKAKLIGIGLALLLFAGWVLKLKADARKEGETAYRQKLDKEVKKVTDDWKKIDNTPASVDDALGRLRQRSTSSGHRPEA